MELTASELYRRARKVAKYYNGMTVTRAEQLDAMKDLQELIRALDSNQTTPRTDLED